MRRALILALFGLSALFGSSPASLAEPVRFGLREAAPMVKVHPDGSLGGLEYEIIQASLRAAGMTLVPYVGSNARLAVAADGKAVEGFAPVIGAPPEGITLTDSYITYQNVAMTLTQRHIKLERIEDLSRYRVLAFQRATQTLGPAFASAVSLAPLYREEPKQALQAAGLLHDRYDVVVADSRILQHHVAAALAETGMPFPSNPAPVTEHRLFAPTLYSAGFRDPALALRFNMGLRQIRADGTYDAIMARYRPAY
jgi:polar amino acid transport system substrate-binding protein